MGSPTTAPPAVSGYPAARAGSTAAYIASTEPAASQLSTEASPPGLPPPMPSTPQTSGVVKFFNKGHGFIRTDAGKDIFVHHTCIVRDGFRYLEKGDVVVFEMGLDDKGKPIARNVRLTSDASASSEAVPAVSTAPEAASVADAVEAILAPAALPPGLTAPPPGASSHELGISKLRDAQTLLDDNYEEFRRLKRRDVFELSEWFKALELRPQRDLEVILSEDDNDALRRGSDAFLMMEVKSKPSKAGVSSSSSSSSSSCVGGSGGGGGSASGGGASRFDVLGGAEVDKEARKVEKKERRLAEREAADASARAREEEAAAAAQRRAAAEPAEANEDEDDEAMDRELAQEHTTAKARPRGGKRDKRVSAKEIDGMSLKQLKRLLEQKGVAVPDDVRQAASFGGDHHRALRAFALEALVYREERVEAALLEEAIAKANKEKEELAGSGSGLAGQALGLAAGVARRVGNKMGFGQASAKVEAVPEPAASADDEARAVKRREIESRVKVAKAQQVLDELD